MISFHGKNFFVVSISYLRSDFELNSRHILYLLFIHISLAEDEDANIISKVEKKRPTPKKKDLIVTVNMQ